MPKINVDLSSRAASQSKIVKINGAKNIVGISFTPALDASKYSYSLNSETGEITINLIGVPYTAKKQGTSSTTPLKTQKKEGVEGNGVLRCEYMDGTKTAITWVAGASCPVNHYKHYTYYEYNYTASIEYGTNTVPNVTVVQPSDNKTLYENDLFTIAGNVTDADTDNFVNVRFSIDNGVAKALVAGISDGVSAIPFNKVLTFKGGKLYDGGTAVTDSLAENVAHTLKVWATDDQGGTSTEKTVTFYVVPNRAPTLTIAQPIIAGSINADKFTISGECADPDGNEIVVAYRINGSVAKEIYRGIGANWNFEVAFAELNVGTNAIVVDVTDSYGFKASKTLKLSKTEIKKPVNKSTARYEIVPPKGTASGVILYIQRTQSLKVSAEVSMTLKGEQEQYTAMDLTNTAPVSAGVLEDEFTFNAEEAKEKIVVKMKMEKMNDYDAITLVSGVLL